MRTAKANRAGSQYKDPSPRNRLGQSKATAVLRHLKEYWVLYLFILPALLDIIIFRYFPMYGLQIAFRNYRVNKGIWGSDWVGLKHFVKFITSPNFKQLMSNTLILSFSTMLFTFPLPIILAIMLNETRNVALKKTAQMITYMPHFISLVAVVGLVKLFTNPSSGIINQIIVALGGEAQNYLAISSAFRPIYVITEVWQHTGWSTIIYLSALTSVSTDTVEASYIDGVNRLQKIWYVDLPTILPTIITLLILSAGNVLSIGFEKVFLLQNDLTRDVSEVIATYTYRLGIVGGQFSFTSAVGMFNNVLNCIILVVVNWISNKVSDTSIF
ncbi:MAG: ABC transporter permease subunit [Eubacteriales bacterium]|nr:ABC transporter permease subunit [Eubacteriales bacterium]